MKLLHDLLQAEGLIDARYELNRRKVPTCPGPALSSPAPPYPLEEILWRVIIVVGTGTNSHPEHRNLPAAVLLAEREKCTGKTVNLKVLF